MQGRIDVQTAVTTAKGWLLEAFADEGAHAPRLEEIRLNDSGTPGGNARRAPTLDLRTRPPHSGLPAGGSAPRTE